jgi:hypothetical protein
MIHLVAVNDEIVDGVGAIGAIGGQPEGIGIAALGSGLDVMDAPCAAKAGLLSHAD